MKASVARSIAVFILLAVFLLAPMHPVLGEEGFKRTATLYIPAVSRLENGTYIGIVSRLDVAVVYPGEGRVYFSAEPLTELDTQATARVASLVASYLAGVDYRSYDFYVSIESPSMIIGGPSAGMAITVGMLACLLGDHVNTSIIGTGMVNPDGTVGPVGGIPEKLEASARSGAKVFLVPSGQLVVYRTVVSKKSVGGITIYTTKRVPVDLRELGRKLGVKVVEVASIREAYAYYTGHSLPPRKAEVSVPPSFAHMLREWIASDSSTAEKLLGEARRIKGNLTRSDESRYLGALISTVKETLEEANKTLAEGMPYSAASYAFQALVYAEYARAVALFFEKGDAAGIASSIIKEANKTLSHVEAGLKTRRIDVGALEAYIAASLRYHQAVEAVGTANKLLGRGIILDTAAGWGALHEAAYAKWRALTAERWLETRKITGIGRTVSVKELGGLAANMLYQAESMTSYAETLYGDISSYTEALENALSDYKKAMEAYRDGDMLSALGYSITSTVEATVSIHQAFSVNATGTVEAARIEALDALARLMKTGFKPITPQSYLEFGEAQSNILSKLYFYELAAAYAKTLYSVAAMVQGTHSITQPTSTTSISSSTSNTNMPTVTSTVTKTVTTTSMSTVTKTNNGCSLNLWFSLALVMLGVMLGAALIAAVRRGEHY